MTEELQSLATELDELAAFDMGGSQFTATDTSTINCAPPEIPDFQIVSPLGQGGMGAVYVARQESLERDVAGKDGDAACSRVATRSRRSGTSRPWSAWLRSSLRSPSDT